MISDCLGKLGYPFGHNAVLPKPELFNGQNAIVAVNVHLGYNQDDSLVINRASLERGIFRSEHIRSYKAEVYTQTVGRSDKFKTGIDKVVQKNVVHTENREIISGRMPVMVKSYLCWLTTVKKGDCDFDQRGYVFYQRRRKGVYCTRANLYEETLDFK
ncbi:hypothetical protein OIU78_027099 [Salix suchowensis]|nr:hypothetical protein OIU78_027099 [Salix suchowensis]